MESRPYQKDLLNAVRKAYLDGVVRQLVVACTGSGKTVCFARLPETMAGLVPGKKMLVLAHRDELISQAISKIRAANPSLSVQREMAKDHANPQDADVVVASVSTLGRKGNSRIGQYDWSDFGIIVTDEAHHSTANTYKSIYEAAGVFSPDSKCLVVGFTATPQRSDGTALATLYQKVVYSYPLRQAITDGWLVDVRGIRVSTDTSLDGIKTVGGDFAQDQLAATVNNPQRNQLIVKAWLDRANGRKTIGFTADIQHARDLALAFQHYGVKAEALWGDDPERADKINRLRSGETTVILNCGVLTEGFDEPSVSCILMARPTKSSVLFTQCVGRATRLFEGKTDALVLDVVDASTRNSLITLPTLMGLSARLDLAGRGLVAAVKEIEDAQKQYPHINFNDLPDISQLQTFVQDVNLFEIRFPSEVETGSQLTWFPSPTGGYVIMLPDKKERLTISQNLLDRWEITGTINGKPAKGERTTLEEAFSAADTVISTYFPEALKLLRRKETWHDRPASPKQIKLLKKFFKGRAIPSDLTAGAASKLISSYMATN